MTQKTQGFALIDLIFVCGIIGVLSGIALPRLMTARSAADAASAIGSMRAISSAQLGFALSCGGGFYAPNLSTLGIAPAGSNQAFINGGLGAADRVSKSSYVMQVSAVGFAGAPATCNGLAGGAAGQGFIAGADPTAAENPRFFATNADGLIFENRSTLFGVMPESGRPPSGTPLH
jgi:type II secretory pathway pseudopilin PulG